jgi:hypothetical protein
MIDLDVHGLRQDDPSSSRTRLRQPPKRDTIVFRGDHLGASPTGANFTRRSRRPRVIKCSANPKGLGTAEEEGSRIVTGDVQPKTVDRAMKGNKVPARSVRARRGRADAGNVVPVATRHHRSDGAPERSDSSRSPPWASATAAATAGRNVGVSQEAIIVPLFLKAQFRDKSFKKNRPRARSTVIVRRASLVNRPARGEFRVAKNGEAVPGRIARADVAAFMVDQLTSNEYLGQAPVIGG